MITAYGEYKTDSRFQRLTTVGVDMDAILEEINSWHRDYTLSWAWIITGKGHREKLTLENDVWMLSSMTSSFPSTAHPHFTQTNTEASSPQPAKPLSPWCEWFASLSPYEKEALRLKWRTRYANMDPEKKAEKRAREAAKRKMRMAKLSSEEKATCLKRIREGLRNESPEHRQARLAKKREYNRKYRNSMTSEQKAASLAKRRAQYREQRSMESPEEREARLAKNRAWYASQPIEALERSRARKRAYNAKYLTPEKKAEREAKRRAKIASETAEEREARLRRRRESRAAKAHLVSRGR